MSNTLDNGVVSEDTKKEIMAIQELLSPSTPGIAKDELADNIVKYVDPNYHSNLDGNIFTYDQWLEAARLGNLCGHTSNPHDRQFFSSGDTLILFGLSNGADYDENGKKVMEQFNVPFCDVFTRRNGQWRLLAVTSSAVKEGNIKKSDS